MIATIRNIVSSILIAALLISGSLAEDVAIEERQSGVYVVNGDFNQPLGKTWDASAGYYNPTFGRRVNYEGNWVVEFDIQCEAGDYAEPAGLNGYGVVRNVQPNTEYTFSYQYLYTVDQPKVVHDGTWQFECAKPKTCPHNFSPKFIPHKYQKTGIQANQWYTYSGLIKTTNVKPTLNIHAFFRICDDFVCDDCPELPVSGKVLLDNFKVVPA